MLLHSIPVLLAFLIHMWISLAAGARGGNTTRIADYIASGIEAGRTTPAESMSREYLFNRSAVVHLSSTSTSAQGSILSIASTSTVRPASANITASPTPVLGGLLNNGSICAGACSSSSAFSTSSCDWTQLVWGSSCGPLNPYALPSTGSGLAYASSCSELGTSWSASASVWKYQNLSQPFTTQYFTHTFITTVYSGEFDTFCDGHARPKGHNPPSTVSTSFSADYNYHPQWMTGTYPSPSPICHVKSKDCSALQAASPTSSFYLASPTFNSYCNNGICGACTIFGGTVQLYYAPVTTNISRDMCASSPTEAPLTYTRTDLSSGPQANGSGPSTVSNGHTFYLNSVYISMQEVYARDACGNPIGSRYPGHILTLASSDVSSARFDTVTAYSDGAAIGYLAYPFNYADLNFPVPWSAYSGQSSCYCIYRTPNPTLSESCPCSTIVDTDYRPALVVPPQVRTLDKAWAHCAIPFGGFYDPPHVLTAQSNPAEPAATLSPGSLITSSQGLAPGVPIASSTAMPAATVPEPGPKATDNPEPDKDPSPSVDPHIPVSDGSSPNNPQVAGSDGGDPPLNGGGNSAPYASPSKDGTNPSKPQRTDPAAGLAPQAHGDEGDGQADPSTPNNIWGAISAALGSSGASEEEDNSPSKIPIADDGFGDSGVAQDDANAEDPQNHRSGEDRDGGSSEGDGSASNPDESGVIDPGNEILSAILGPDSNKGVAAGVAIPTFSTDAEGSGEAGKDPNYLALNRDDAAAPVVTISGLKIAADYLNPNVAIVDGQGVAKGAPATTIRGVPVSFGTQGLVVGGDDDGKNPATIAPINAAINPQITSAPLRFGSSIFSPDSKGVYILTPGVTLNPGGVATISGTRISLALDGNSAVIGSSTEILDITDSASSPASLTVGSSAIAANSNGDYVLSPDTTLTPGGVAIIDGTRISLASNGAFAIVGSSTELLAPSLTLAPLTVGDRVFTANGFGDCILAPGKTLKPGEEVTVDGMVVSLAPDESYAVVGGATELLETPTKTADPGKEIASGTNTVEQPAVTGTTAVSESAGTRAKMKIRRAMATIIGILIVSLVIM